MKDLIVLCGTSHSGKSDYARQYEVTHTIISSDEIRAELGVKYREAEDKVWQIFAARKFEAMLRLDNVILDACHISKRARSHSLQGPNAHHRKTCNLPRTTRALPKRKRGYGVLPEWFFAFLKEIDRPPCCRCLLLYARWFLPSVVSPRLGVFPYSCQERSNPAVRE